MSNVIQLHDLKNTEHPAVQAHQQETLYQLAQAAQNQQLLAELMAMENTLNQLRTSNYELRQDNKALAAENAILLAALEEEMPRQDLGAAIAYMHVNKSEHAQPAPQADDYWQKEMSFMQAKVNELQQLLKDKDAQLLLAAEQNEQLLNALLAKD